MAAVRLEGNSGWVWRCEANDTLKVEVEMFWNNESAAKLSNPSRNGISINPSRVFRTVPFVALSANWLVTRTLTLDRSGFAVLGILCEKLPNAKEGAAEEHIALKRASEEGDCHPIALRQTRQASRINATHHGI